jgi:DNA (cytosine-5)-methyltransferase 1
MTRPVKKPSFASLFSGCGGFDLGFVNSGFEPSAAFDCDEDAVRTFRRNLGDHIELRDLRRGVPSMERMKKVNVLIAGPPCQGFSTAGKRDLHDDRNKFLVLTGHLAEEAKPDVLVVENVPAALSGDHAKYWDALTGILRFRGYRTCSFRLEAAQLGMAQIRKRLFLLAWRTGRDITIGLPRQSPTSLRESLAGVDGLPNNLPRHLLRNSQAWKIARCIGSGQKLSNVRGGKRAVHTWQIPTVFGATTPHERTLLELVLRLRRQSRTRDSGDADPVSIERLAKALGEPFRRLLRSLVRKGYICYKGTSIDLVHTFNGMFRRLAWDAPSCTVDTRFGEPRYFLHPDQDRGFTVREAARIQGFPDHFIFEGETKAQYRLVGNAVPPPLAQFTAELTRHLLGQIV